MGYFPIQLLVLKSTAIKLIAYALTSFVHLFNVFIAALLTLEDLGDILSKLMIVKYYQSQLNQTNWIILA